MLVTALGLAWAVNSDGGVLAGGWYICLLMLGCAALLSWLPKKLPVERLHGWQEKSIALLLAYILLQTVPIPLVVLKLISPARAALVELAAPITGREYFSTLSAAPAATVECLLRLLAYCLVFFLIRELTLRTKGSWVWAPAIPLIVIGLWQAWLGQDQFASGAVVAGTYENRNHFSGLLEMILPCAAAYGIGLVKGDDGRTTTLAQLVSGGAILMAAAAMFIAILDSQSKTGFTAMLVSFLVMGGLALSVRIPVQWRFTAGLALILLFGAAFIFLPSDRAIEGMGAALVSDPTGEGRVPVLRDTLHMIADYPLFGSGLGSFGSVFVKYQTGVVDSSFNYAHNDFIQLLAELGILGAGLLFLSVFLAFSGVFSVIRHRWPARRCMGLGCIGGIVAIAVHSLADFNLYMPANALVVVWLMAMLSGLRFPAGPEAASAERGFSLRPVLLVGACVLLLFSVPALVFSESYRGDAIAEKAFCRFGICDIETVLAASPSSSGPPREQGLREAIRREPASPGHWAELGEMLLQSHRVVEAEPMFANAAALGPNVPPVLLQIADFYQQTGRPERALALVSRALSQTTVYRNAAFDWLSMYQIPAPQVVSRALPNQAGTYTTYLRYLMETGDADRAAEVWDVASSRHFLDEEQAREYVNWLSGRKQYALAAREWAGFRGDRAPGYLEDNWVFNGDFELALSPLALDWSTTPQPGVQVTLDPETRHSGQAALRFRFDRTRNVGATGVSERVPVEPGNYRFEAAVRALGLTTDQGVRVQVSDAEDPSRLHWESDPVLSTVGWESIARNICVTPRTRLLEISVVRQPSLKFDSAIWGLYWLDSVRLAKTGNACVR